MEDYEDYLAGARNLYKFMGIKEREQVLLIPTFEFFNSDPSSLEALMQVGKEIGAEVSVVMVEACGIRGNPPRPIVRAIESSDAFIGMGDKTPNPISGHNLTGLRARWDYGAKQVNIQGGKGVLATECSKFPVEIFLAIGRSLHTKLKRGKGLELVDDKGTHLYFPYKPQDIYGGATLEVGHLEPGQRIAWPLNGFVILPEDSFSGVAMVDCIYGVPKILEKPARFVIENCRVVEIEDREETKKIREEWKKPENSNFVDKVIIGVNPKGSISKGIHRPSFGELSRAAGVTQIGIGDRPGHVSSLFYTVVFLLRPTVILHGEVLFDHGRPSAFDEPEVRKIASKYGDPDELLTTIP